MKHNNFKFTIKFIIPKKKDQEFLSDYMQKCCDEMNQKCVEIGEVLISYLQAGTYIAYLTLTTKDYAVPEVGVDLVAAWIEQLYKNCDGFIIDVVIVHPKSDPPARGAVIRWDYINDCPIVKVITN